MILLAILIIAFPFIDKLTSLRWTAQIIFALIFVILGLGLNIVVGYAGLLDLGYAAFFAIGAYTTGILSSPQHGIHLNFWLVVLDRRRDGCPLGTYAWRPHPGFTR